MSDDNKITTRYHYDFIHNVLGNFYKDSLEYFTKYLYPRFRYSVMGTYEKSVEMIFQKEKLSGREVDKPNLPALILNPMGDFQIADTGRQFFRFPNLSPGIASKLFQPIYLDEDVIIISSFSRIQGEIELIALASSFYEYCDLRLLFLQIFGGYDRVIYPVWFNSFIIIPKELYEYEYENDVTGKKYKLDWESAGVETKLVKTTNKNEYVYPCRIRPWYSLKSISEASTKYGGNDKLPDWRFTANIEFQVELPSYIILQTDYLVDNITFNIGYASTYSDFPLYKPPEIRYIQEAKIDFENIEDEKSINFNEVDLTELDPFKFSVECSGKKRLNVASRYFHFVTQEEYDDSTSDLEIIIDEAINLPEERMIVNSTFGSLDYGDHYTYEKISDFQSKITIKRKYVKLDVGQLFEIYTYSLEE